MEMKAVPLCGTSGHGTPCEPSGGGQACHWQALWVNDRVYVFIFLFPFESSAKARRKQLVVGPDEEQIW